MPPRWDLPPTLTARHRAVLHAACSEAGIGHASSGDGDARALSIGDLTPAATPVSLAVGDGSDGALVAALTEAVGPAFGAAVEQALAAPAPATTAAPPAVPRPPPPSKLVPPTTSDAAAYAATVLPLLAAERDAEMATARAALAAGGRGGHRLAPLRVDGWEGGLMGRTLVTLVYAKGGGGGGGKKGASSSAPRAPLPAHRFSPHDLVELRPARAPPADPPLASGVVTRLTDDAVTVACDDAPDLEDADAVAGSFRLDRLANDVTHRRLTSAVGDLARAARTGEGHAAGVVDVLFGGGEAGAVDPPPAFQPYNPALDASQLAAVGATLAAKRLALVHGPPGTGKTTTVVEIVRQLVARGDRVLLAAPSNVAVDTLVERLVAADPRLPLVRLGHPARLLPSVLSCCLDARVAASDAAGLAADARGEARKVVAALAKCGRRDGDKRRRLRAELKLLSKEARARDAKAVAEVVSRARVVAATLTGLNPRLVGGAVGGGGGDGDPAARRGFDVAVVDEAAQALEPAAWAALLRAPRAVLAGDHRQLPPTVTSQDAAGAGLGVTLFERAHALLERRAGPAAAAAAAAAPAAPLPAARPHPCVAMLTTQYRMHASICGWASGEMYGGALVAADGVAGHTLADLLRSRGEADKADAAEEDDVLAPILLIDTAGCDCDEVKEGGGGGGGDDASTANPREAAAAWAHVRRLLAAGLRDGDVGVIAPYSAQVAVLRGLRPPPGEPGSGVEISTVDGFQGREKEAIVISATRSNPARGVGFLADARRMNVAVTRARRAAALVCDTETLASDPFLGRLVAWFSEHGVHESAACLLD